MLPAAENISADNLDFAWDRPETAESLHRRLATCTGAEWLRTAAWLMREARVTADFCTEYRQTVFPAGGITLID